VYYQRHGIENVGYMRKQLICTLLLVGLLVAAMSATVYAGPSSLVTVHIGIPNFPPDLGITLGPYWIGQFPITITPSGGPTYADEAYCLNIDGIIHMNTNYPAQILPATDDAAWREVAYILSWHPAIDPYGGATVQSAIWRILNGYNGFLGLPGTIETDAASWVADAFGKDVARQGDQLNWISPNSGSTSTGPGQTATFQVQLTSSTNVPRPNVQIDFSAILTPPSGPSQTLGSAYFSSMQAFTDSNGKAQVSVTVPPSVPAGSKITVQASTQSIWPQKFLDLNNADDQTGLQNLIGLGPTLDLNVSTNIYILGYILVLPQSALGPLSALVASAAAYIIFTKLRQLTKQTHP